MNTFLAVENMPDRSRVLSQAVSEAAKRMKVRTADLVAILGCSQPTISRLSSGKSCLHEGTKEWELSAHFVRLYRSLSSMVGGDDILIASWMKSPNKAFNQQVPLDYIKRVDGLINVCNYLDAHRAKV